MSFDFEARIKFYEKELETGEIIEAIIAVLLVALL